MGMLYNNSSYAEIQNGCFFAERFEGTDNMLKNGGNMSGNIVSYPMLTGRTVKTVIAILKRPVATNRQVTINGSGASVIVTAGTTYSRYTNASGVAISNFNLANFNDFAFVACFTNQLTSAEEESYYYNLIHKPVFELRSTANMKSYNSSAQTLKDNSGYNRNATITGSPVKLATKGLVFNGNDKIEYPTLNVQIGAIYICFKPATFYRGETEPDNTLFSVGDGLPNPVMSLGVWSGAATNETFIFASGASGQGNYIKDYISNTEPHVICANFSTNTNTYDIWLDGSKRTLFVAGSQLTSLTMNGLPRVGMATTGYNPFNGTIYEFAFSSLRHGDAQVMEISRQMLESIYEV